MSKPMYRARLPQTASKIFLTDGGMETTLIFHEGLELPLFMAFPLLDDERGHRHLRDYYRRYCKMAATAGLGFVLESPTWRANRDWAGRISYSGLRLAGVNRKAIELMLNLRAEFETPASPMPISGNIGPRGDGYVPGKLMSAAEAADYHGEQIATFADTAADMVSAFTLNYAEEAIGIARAASAAEMPVVISFTVETDGRLPTGQTLREAIEQTDMETGAAPAYYMLNCAHPTHFEAHIAKGGRWLNRLRGLRANASCRSHAELDAATDLDAGDPVDLGKRYADLRRRQPHINILGGCCGTDHRHVEQICFACTAVAA
ncbi:MAG: homocysteine S-methyltransferase family protein [Xanthobacteraceae bacterium]|uniref:homocysteine S-methyltransferase family protein n=1 Tax=Pseudolabrys sp. TaxID=1960880 RepID=UPI003D0B941A